jgi:hypothetical protein
MKYRGVVYDVGLNFNGDGKFSVEPFNPTLVKFDMRAIANDLHANAVRIEGEEIHRLVTATRSAHAVGLTVFFNPWKMNANVDETRTYLREAAQAAEQLKNEGVDIVFVAGCEYTIFSKGVFPGDSFKERAMWLGTQLAGDERALSDPPKVLLGKSMELNQALQLFVEDVRVAFKGPVTYSAGTWESINWSIFDIVGIDYYRRGETEEQYIAGLERHRYEDKSLVVMEFGCCAYEGAAARGDGGFVLLEGTNADGTGIFKDGAVPSRSEREQADYVETQLNLLAQADVHAAFVYVFAFPAMRAGEGARDLDMMSFSLVKTFVESDTKSMNMPPWEPKEAFWRVAEYFRKHGTSVGRASEKRPGHKV